MEVQLAPLCGGGGVGFGGVGNSSSGMACLGGRSAGSGQDEGSAMWFMVGHVLVSCSLSPPWSWWGEGHSNDNCYLYWHGGAFHSNGYASIVHTTVSWSIWNIRAAVSNETRYIFNSMGCAPIDTSNLCLYPQPSYMFDGNSQVFICFLFVFLRF